jgi:DNA invertase Pin-like site-specific DNA recombinase
MGKIAARHLERKACVYVRQSSLAQVQHHRESTARQYNLRERAVTLGWRAEQVDVIDDDQGKSGSSASGREGFQRLISEVALGQVGAVLGLEVSRLARSCADWYRLLEIAALAGTLIVDEEGVYDPNHYNDRLLLGLKGTLSEAELHFLKQRMIGGRRNKARRGEFRLRLPVGYVWEPGAGIHMDPDERVRGVVGFFFRCFERLGTAAEVARFFDTQHLAFPHRDGYGSPAAAVTWGALHVARAVHILHNPVYAGIYSYARQSAQAEDPEDPVSGGRIWLVGSHPGYITPERYEANVARLVENRDLYHGVRNQGSAREGPSLLQGLVLCGRCGRHMNVTYRSAGLINYTCRTSTRLGRCQDVNVRHVERLVEEEVLGAISREELELAAGALEKLSERTRELDAEWQRRLEAARYEVERAARRYHRVEPENRLVARTLESEWNARLEELARLKREYDRVREQPPFVLDATQREKILALAEDLPKLWHAPTTRLSQRKQLLRLLVEDVTLTKRDEPWCIEVGMRWKTGVVTRHRAQRPLPHPQTTAPEVIARMRELFLDHEDEDIAAILNAEGYRTGYGKLFTTVKLASTRRRFGMKKREVHRRTK